MDLLEREVYISRIVAGYIKIETDLGEVLLRAPSRKDKYEANIIYRETLLESQLLGLFTEEEVLDILWANKLWDKEKEEKLETLKKDIEEIKVKLFQLSFRADERRKISLMLKKANEEIDALLNVRHSLDHLTDKGAALTAKFNYMIISSLYFPDGTPVSSISKDWHNDSRFGRIIDQATQEYIRNLIKEKQYRELARNEPWRSIWAAKDDGLFNIPSVDLTEEQRSLVLWSRFYDNVYESSECPSDAVIDDDDRLDGWAIVQRRKREQHSLKEEIESKLSGKVRNAEEIFIPVGSLEEAKKIDSINTTEARIIKQQRLNKIRKEGEVRETQMPDTRQKFLSQLYQARKERYGG